MSLWQSVVRPFALTSVCYSKTNDNYTNKTNDNYTNKYTGKLTPKQQALIDIIVDILQKKKAKQAKNKTAHPEG